MNRLLALCIGIRCRLAYGLSGDRPQGAQGQRPRQAWALRPQAQGPKLKPRALEERAFQCLAQVRGLKLEARRPQR